MMQCRLSAETLDRNGSFVATKINRDTATEQVLYLGVRWIMNAEEFVTSLSAELEKHSVSVIKKWNKVLSILPEEAKAISVIISPTQDGDGMFDIFVSLDGPDLYVLNQKIHDHYQLFSPIHTVNGIEPYIPSVDPFDVDFEINDAVVDTVLTWLEKLWKKLEIEQLITIPVRICGDEGYGSRSSVQLN